MAAMYTRSNFCLAFDGRTHWLDQGYRLKFEIRKGEATTERPLMACLIR